MSTLPQHLILIGFKHTGKTIIGKTLATRMTMPFVDLDQRLEALFAEKFKKDYICRDIAQQYGEAFFRSLESEALALVLQEKPSVIATGGGTPLTKKNQDLLKPHCIIHIKAPRDVVFARIMAGGQPALFATDKSPSESFDALWEERIQVYEQLANLAVENVGTIDAVIDEILRLLRQHQLLKFT